MKQMTARQILDALVKEDKILEIAGQIRFFLGDVDIVVRQKDVVGNIIQEWLEGWLKKVWEITRRMADWPLNLQVKKGVVHKIRPGVWYSERPRDFRMFSCLEHFISAMEETVYQNEDTRKKGSQWKNRFLDSYKRFYGRTLQIPKWDEIKDSYLITKLPVAGD